MTPFNIHGRICLETTVMFGAVGLVLVYIIHPQISQLVNLIPDKVTTIIAIITLIIFVIDLIMSTFATFKIRHKVNKASADMTKEIKKLVTAYYTKAEREIRKTKRRIERELHEKQQQIKQELEVTEEKIDKIIHPHKK